MINATWFSVSAENALPCPSCGALLEGCLPSLDHHPVTCSSCKDYLVILSTSGHREIAVSLTKSPGEVQRFFLWSHSTLDELEFVTLPVSLEDMLA